MDINCYKLIFSSPETHLLCEFRIDVSTVATCGRTGKKIMKNCGKLAR